MYRAVALILLLIASIWMSRPALSQVRRCTAANGALIYTDRTCADIDATERIPTPGIIGAVGNAGGYAYRGCARSVQDLAYALGTAIQSGDVNQVAGLYDFTGASTASGYKLMDRLGSIASRPLVDVQPMYAGGYDPYSDPYSGIIEFDENGAVVQRAAVKPRLVGLRVEQTLANSSTPSRTVFGLRKNMGCWWLHF